MSLTEEQTGVLKGMAAGVGITLAAMACAVKLLGPQSASIDLAGRIAMCAISLLAPAIALAFAIARLARFRFLSPQDIAGSASSGSGSSKALLLQSLLQNTLEQAVLAVLAYAAWAALAPGHFMAALPAAAVLFLLGRILFFAGYAGGARSRALGFALTFYPTLALICGDVFFVVMELAKLVRSMA